MTDKQLLEGCTIIRVHDKSRDFEYCMLEKDGYSYRIDEKKLSGNLASLVKKYDLDVVELTSKELTTRVNNQQKKGYNYFEKDDRVFGLGLLSKGQGVMDEIQESGVWDSLWMLGMGVASARNAQTFSKKVSVASVPKNSRNSTQYQQYKNELMKGDIIENSKPIISSSDLKDTKVISELTKNGSSMSDWAKMESTYSYETSMGKGKVHYYQNLKTSETSFYDVKMKVPIPKDLKIRKGG
ncbi:hypothetical protein [Enterococcus faecalis]|uniref:hypothetical protein n=2 Tax=Enterococcus faecalis TaxID=1351 RepID=UPI001EE92FA9|nr:hypothetical protein [Enterococcus faecalis]